MVLSDLNPYIRYATQIFYTSEDNPVKVRDCRLFYILKGEGEIFIENQHYSLTDNSLFFCRSGSEYNIVSKNGLSIISLNFDLTQQFKNHVNSMYPVSQKKAVKILSETFSDSKILNSHIFIPDAGMYHSQMQKILYEFNTQKIHFREISASVLKEILTDFHRTKLKNTAPSSGAVSSVIKFINTNFQKEISNKELAAIAGYHEYYLNRLFLKHTGKSMHNYILNMRITEAKRLILNTDLPCNIIAENVGFKNYTHFSSYFKKAFGISPAQYRARFKNKI